MTTLSQILASHHYDEGYAAPPGARNPYDGHAGARWIDAELAWQWGHEARWDRSHKARASND